MEARNQRKLKQQLQKSSILLVGVSAKINDHYFLLFSVNGRSQVAPSSYLPCTWRPGRLPHCASSSLLSPVWPTAKDFWWMCKKTFYLIPPWKTLQYLHRLPVLCWQGCLEPGNNFQFLCNKAFPRKWNKIRSLVIFCTWTFVMVFVPELLWGKLPQQGDHFLHSFSPEGKYE